MTRSIQDLRRERGYRNAREFADALGISASSMSRYEKQPSSIPMHSAWVMADALGCSIDEVVGHESAASAAGGLQGFYDADGSLTELSARRDAEQAARDKSHHDLQVAISAAMMSRAEEAAALRASLEQEPAGDGD